MEALRIGHPPRVGRPGRLEPAPGIIVRVGIDRDCSAAPDVNGPQMQVIVFEQQILAVRRPGRRREEALRGQPDCARLHARARISNHQLVFAARIGEPGDLRAVGRPYGASMVRTWTLREIASVTLLNGHRHDLAACLEGRPHAGRRQRRVPDRRGDPCEVWPRPWEIARDVDRQACRLSARDIDEMNVSGLLVDNGVWSRGGAHDVEVVVVRELRELLRIEPVREQIGRGIGGVERPIRGEREDTGNVLVHESCQRHPIHVDPHFDPVTGALE